MPPHPASPPLRGGEESELRDPRHDLLRLEELVLVVLEPSLDGAPPLGERVEDRIAPASVGCVAELPRDGLVSLGELALRHALLDRELSRLGRVLHLVEGAAEEALLLRFLRGESLLLIAELLHLLLDGQERGERVLLVALLRAVLDLLATCGVGEERLDRLELVF